MNKKVAEKFTVTVSSNNKIGMERRIKVTFNGMTEGKMDCLLRALEAEADLTYRSSSFGTSED